VLHKNKYFDLLFHLLAQFCDPIQLIKAAQGLGWYQRDWRAYKKLPNAEPLHFVDAYPQLHDRTSITPIDAHYFYVNGWAIRHIVAQRAIRHVDVGSQTIFANLLGAMMPVIYVDYRPLHVNLSGLDCVGADILNLPFDDNSIDSLSCLHVAEHVGLGRYGDSLNPSGTRQGCIELKRVLARGGNLYFALPVGLPRVCFNAHRIHSSKTILDYFEGLELVEFSGVHDNGHFVEHVGLDEFSNIEYACGMFWFKKR
jgi:SAM-dependent methyltransferase